MSRLAKQLDAVRRRHRRLTRQLCLLRAAWWWLAALWLATLADAMWSVVGGRLACDPYAIVELPNAVRAAVGLALLVGLGAAIWHGRLPRSVRKRTIRGYARWCEQQAAVSGNVLINATDLGKQASEPDASALTKDMARRAIAQADAVSAQLRPEELIRIDPVRSQMGRAIAVVMLWAICLVVGPVFIAGWPLNLVRLFDPWGDHPPAGMLAIHAGVPDGEIATGDDVPVTASAVPGSPSLRMRTEDGRMLPMMSIDRTIYRAVLADVQRPTRFVVEGGHTRSRWRRFTPLPLPRITGVSISVQPANSDVHYPWPAGQEVVAAIGSTVRVTMRSDREDAAIANDSATGLSIELTVPEGEHRYDLALVRPDGLRSRRSVALIIRGLTHAELADIAEGTTSGEATQGSESGTQNGATQTAANAGGDPTHTAALDSGTPTDAATAGGSAKPDGQQSGQAHPGLSGADGEGLGGDGSKPIPLPQLVSGLIREEAIRQAMQQPDVKSFADQAPPSYREKVARYFLRITRDRQKEAAPSDSP